MTYFVASVSQGENSIKITYAKWSFVEMIVSHKYVKTYAFNNIYSSFRGERMLKNFYNFQFIGAVLIASLSIVGFQNCGKLRANNMGDSVLPHDTSADQESSVNYLPNSIVPEYFASRAIVFSYGAKFQESQDVRITASFRNEALAERHNLFTTVIKNAGGAKGIFLEELTLMNQNSMASKLKQALSAGGVSDKQYQIVEIDLATTYFDVWTRDYVGLPSTSDSGVLTLLKTDFRGIGVNPILATRLSPTILSNETNKTERSFEGGNIMTDSKGMCFYADAETIGEIPATIAGFCRKIIALPALPHEGTGHIDLFAKLVNDKQAVVAAYQSDNVIVQKEIGTFNYLCSSEVEFEKEDQANCELASAEVPVLNNDPTQSLVTTFSNLKQFIPNLLNVPVEIISFDGRHGRLPLSELPSQANWPEHSAYSRALLEKEGIETFKILSPMPYVTINRAINKSPSGRTYTFYEGRLVFRSFINSLVTNGKAFVPVYKKIDDGVTLVTTKNEKGEDVRMTLNEAAMQTYKSLGLEVYDVPSDYSITSGGAVHCLTHQIPK